MRKSCELALATLVCVLAVSSGAYADGPVTEKQVAGHKICWNDGTASTFGGNHRYSTRGPDGRPEPDKAGEWMIARGVLSVNRTIGPFSVGFTKVGDEYRQSDGTTGKLC